MGTHSGHGGGHQGMAKVKLGDRNRCGIPVGCVLTPSLAPVRLKGSPR